MTEVDVITSFLGIRFHTRTLGIGEQEHNLKRLRLPTEKGDIVLNNPVLTLTKEGVELKGAGVAVESGKKEPISTQKFVEVGLGERLLSGMKLQTIGKLGLRREVRKTDPEKTLHRQVRAYSQFYPR